MALKTLGGRKLNDSLGILMLPHGVQIVAEDRDALQAFVKKYISAAFSDPRATSLMLGGVNSVGAGPVSFTFPLEADYKKGEVTLVFNEKLLAAYKVGRNTVDAYARDVKDLLRFLEIIAVIIFYR